MEKLCSVMSLQAQGTTWTIRAALGFDMMMPDVPAMCCISATPTLYECVYTVRCDVYVVCVCVCVCVVCVLFVCLLFVCVLCVCCLC